MSFFASSMKNVPKRLPTPRDPECNRNQTFSLSSRQTSMKWFPVPSVPRWFTRAKRLSLTALHHLRNIDAECDGGTEDDRCSRGSLLPARMFGSAAGKPARHRSDAGHGMDVGGRNRQQPNPRPKTTGSATDTVGHASMQRSSEEVFRGVSDFCDPGSYHEDRPWSLHVSKPETLPRGQT